MSRLKETCQPDFLGKRLGCIMDVSIALGGGGVKGVAHIGVLQSLEENGFRVKAIAGTSAGALVGALYASGMAPGEIRNLLHRLDQHKWFSRSPADGPSLLGMAGIAKALGDALGNRCFEDLIIPFACTSVDSRTAQEVVFREGKLINAVLASAAFPGVLPPIEIGSALLIDGGVLDPVPVSLARWLAPGLPVVAVVLNPEMEKWADMPSLHLPVPTSIPTPIIEQVSRMRIAQAFGIFFQSVDISARMLTEMRLEVDKPEVIIRPDVGKFGFFDPIEPDQLIQIGREAVEDSLPALRNSYHWTKQLARRFRQSPPPTVVTAVEP
jgi:NTE family protein